MKNKTKCNGLILLGVVSMGIGWFILPITPSEYIREKQIKNPMMKIEDRHAAERVAYEKASVLFCLLGFTMIATGTIWRIFEREVTRIRPTSTQ